MAVIWNTREKKKLAKLALPINMPSQELNEQNLSLHDVEKNCLKYLYF